MHCISLFKRNIWRPRVFALKLNIVQAAECRDQLVYQDVVAASRLFACTFAHAVVINGVPFIFQRTLNHLAIFAWTMYTHNVFHLFTPMRWVHADCRLRAIKKRLIANYSVFTHVNHQRDKKKAREAQKKGIQFMNFRSNWTNENGAMSAHRIINLICYHFYFFSYHSLNHLAEWPTSPPNNALMALVIDS